MIQSLMNKSKELFADTLTRDWIVNKVAGIASENGSAPDQKSCSSPTDKTPKLEASVPEVDGAAIQSSSGN